MEGLKQVTEGRKHFLCGTWLFWGNNYIQFGSYINKGPNGREQLKHIIVISLGADPRHVLIKILSIFGFHSVIFLWFTLLDWNPCPKWTMPLLGEGLIKRRRKKWRVREEIGLGEPLRQFAFLSSLSISSCSVRPWSISAKRPHSLGHSLFLLVFSTQGPETQVLIACPWAAIPMTLSQSSIEMFWVFHDILWNEMKITSCQPEATWPTLGP